MSDPVRALLDKARRYVRSAELVRTSGDFDSAASRLYYAMFYCAEAPGGLAREAWEDG